MAFEPEEAAAVEEAAAEDQHLGFDLAWAVEAVAVEELRSHR